MQRLFLLFALSLFLLCAAELAGAQEQSGYPSFVPQDCHQFDCVNLLTNTVSLNVPIRSKAGAVPVSARGVASYYMTTSGGAWVPSFAAQSPISSDTPWGFQAEVNGFISFGWSGAFAFNGASGVACPGSGTTTKYTNWEILTADGTQHPLPTTVYTDQTSSGTSCLTGSGFTAQTTDGSGLTATVPSNGITASSIYSRNGSLVTSSSITDSNGNAVTWNGTSAITDSMGVTALSVTNIATGPFSWTDVNAGSPQVSLTIPGSTKVETNFGCSGVNEYGPSTLANADLPTTITLADSRTIGLAYEPTYNKAGYVTGRVQQITLPTSGTITYGYSDTTGHHGINCFDATVPKLTRTLGNGDATTYVLSNGINTVTDPGGNVTEYEFNTTGLVSAIVHDKGASTILYFDTYCYNVSISINGNCGSNNPTMPITELFIYHQIYAQTGFSTVDTKFDTYGNVTYRAEYDFGNTTSPARATTITYYQGGTSCGALTNVNVNDKPCEISTTQGGSTVADKKFYYDGNGNLTKTSVWNGSAWIGQTSANTFNANGTPIKTFDLNNNETDYTYSSSNYSDGCNAFYAVPFPTKIENMGTTIATSAYYDCTGGVRLKDGDANGNLTTYGYKTATGVADPYWRLSSTTDAIGTATVYKTYPTSSQPTTFWSSDFVFNSGNSIEGTLQTLDSYGRTIGVQKAQSPSGSSYDTVSSAYSWTADAPYFQVQTSQPCSQTSGNPCASFVHTLEQGVLGPYTQTTASNETLTTTYTQNDVLSVLSPAPTGENVKQTQTEYDGLGRPKYVCRIGTTAATGSGTGCGQNTGSASGTTDAYTYTQGAGYTEVYVTRAGVQQRTSYFDALGRLYKRITPEGGTWNYYYDTAACTGGAASAGNLTCVKDPNGNVLNYFYDAMNRVTKVNANGTTCRHFYFDQTYGTVPTGVTTPTYTLGLLAEDSTDNCSGTLITDEWHSYDKDHREIDSYVSTPHATQYYHSTATFFENGAVKTLQLASPSLYTMTYTLDGEGRTNSAKVGSTTMVNNVTFDPAAGGNCAGGVNTVSLIGSSSDSDAYTCDANTGRMKTYAFTVGATPATLTGTLTWNANGSLASLATTDGFNAGGTLTCTDSYDDWGRLGTFLCGSGNWGQDFAYDVYDNLNKSVPTGYSGTSWAVTYNSSNQFSGGTFDSNGDTKADGNGDYWGWNEFGKMAWYHSSSIAPTCGTNGSCATYDAFGRMVEQTIGSVYKQYWNTQAGQVQMSGTTANFAYWPVSAVGTVVVNGNAGTSLYAHKDWIGNARVVSSHGRAVTADQAYTPYGEMYATFGSTAAVYDLFAGMTANFNNGVQQDTPNRELAVFSRWLSPDPANIGWNRYAYVTNPNSQSDPSGLGQGGLQDCNTAGNCNILVSPCAWDDPCGPGTIDGGPPGDGGSGSWYAGWGSGQDYGVSSVGSLPAEDPGQLERDLEALAGPSAGPNGGDFLGQMTIEQFLMNLLPASVVNLGPKGDVFNGWDPSLGQWAIEQEYLIEVVNGFGQIYDYGTVKLNETVTSGAKTGSYTTLDGIVPDWMGYPLRGVGPATSDDTFPQIVSQQRFTATMNLGYGPFTMALSTVFQNTYSLTNGVLTTSRTVINP